MICNSKITDLIKKFPYIRPYQTKIHLEEVFSFLFFLFLFSLNFDTK